MILREQTYTGGIQAVTCSLETVKNLKW